MQPAASLVLFQGEDQQLPGRASSGLWYLSVWSPGPLSHRSLIFTSMSSCQNAGCAISCLTCFLPFLQWLRVNPLGAIPSNISPHWLLRPKRYHSSCPKAWSPTTSTVWLLALPSCLLASPFPTLALCFSEELELSSPLLCHSLYLLAPSDVQLIFQDSAEKSLRRHPWSPPDILRTSLQSEHLYPLAFLFAYGLFTMSPRQRVPRRQYTHLMPL